MNIKSRLLLAAAFVLLILMPGLSINLAWLTFPQHPWLEENLPLFPYIVYASGLVLCWLFYNSREFNLLVILLVVYYAISQFFWQKGLAGFQKELLFNLICILVPINFLIFNALKERGILNQHGFKRLFFVILQIAACVWLIKTNQFGISTYIAMDVLLHPIQGKSIIKPLAQIVICFTTIVLFIHWLWRPSQLRGTWLLALISIILAFQFVLDTQLATTYFTISGLILVSGIIINSYNLAYKDELTQLPSRRALKQQLASLGKTYALAMVDVDHFKKLNDNHGHDVGDEVLKMLASHLQAVEGGGKAFRYGGEEFTIVFPGKDSNSASVYLDALRTNIASKPFVVRDKKRPSNKPANKSDKKKNKSKNLKKLNVTVSIGIAENQAKFNSTQDIMKAADNALYQAKKKGRNRVEIG